MRLSLSTLNRRIAAGEVQTKREPRGRRHRVYVMLDDDPPVTGDAADSEVTVARERIRGLEARVDLLQGQLEQKRRRNAGLVDELKAAASNKGAGTHRTLVAVLASWRVTRRQRPHKSLRHLSRAGTGLPAWSVSVCRGTCIMITN